MKLYHGTSDKYLADIRANGLKPRGKKKGNWEHTILSRPTSVYLTDVYAPYFAINAVDNPNVEKPCVIEIDTDRIDLKRLHADEDGIEQINRGHDNIGGTMHQRTIYYRKHALEHPYAESLFTLGTCAYDGVIPAEAITRVATWDPRAQAEFSWIVMDPTISVINYAIMAWKYRALNSWLFGDLPDGSFVKDPRFENAPITGADAASIQLVINASRIELPKNREGIIVS